MHDRPENDADNLEQSQQSTFREIKGNPNSRASMRILEKEVFQGTKNQPHALSSLELGSCPGAIPLFTVRRQRIRAITSFQESRGSEYWWSGGSNRTSPIFQSMASREAKPYVPQPALAADGFYCEHVHGTLVTCELDGPLLIELRIPSTANGILRAF